MRLMDKSDFLSLFYVASAGQDKWFIKTVEMVVEDTPDIDAVPVVRCRDCKCFMEYTRDYARLFLTAEGADGDCYIRVMNSDDKQFCACKYDDYCSYGERKDGDT